MFSNTYPVSSSVSFLIQRRHKPKTFANSINTSLGFRKFEFFPGRFLVLIRRRQMIITHFLMKSHTQSRRHRRNNPNPICGAAPTNFMLLREMSHKLFWLKKKWIKKKLNFSESAYYKMIKLPVCDGPQSPHLQNCSYVKQLN